MSTAIRILRTYQKPLLLLISLVVLFILFSLRNLDPILYPTVYAEDGPWTAKVIDSGLWDAAFHTRVFPILGFVLFYKSALILLDVFFHGNLFYLPLVYFFLSNLFFSICVISTYFAFRNAVSTNSLICLLLIIILMPVGGDGNEIYGRILNLGFIFPVLQAVLLSAVLLNKQSVPLAFIALLLSLVSCLTLPVGVGFQLIFVVITTYLGYKNKSKYFYSLAAISFLIILFSLLMISGSAMHDSGGADFPVKGSAFIEFSLARVLLYPLLFSIYTSLNDITVVCVFLCVVAVIIFGIKRFYQNGKIIINQKLFAVVFIYASFGIYYLSLIVMRRGLSALFGEYTTTFPDRYFLGVNILFAIALIFLLDRTIFSRLINFLLVVPMLFSVSSIFELGHPATKVSNSSLWTEEYCNNILSNSERTGGLFINIPPENWHVYSAKYHVNEQQRQNIQQRCEKSSLYDFALLQRFQQPILVQRNATQNMATLPSMSIAEAHSVDINPVQGGFGIKVTGDDPYIVLISSEELRRSSHFMFHFSIQTATPAVLQAYYLLKGTDGYSEENSIHFRIEAGQNLLYLTPNMDVSKDRIRIDLPDGSRDEFIFSGLLRDLVN